LDFNTNHIYLLLFTNDIFSNKFPQWKNL
jgi:hypothetical protein